MLPGVPRGPSIPVPEDRCRVSETTEGDGGRQEQRQHIIGVRLSKPPPPGWHDQGGRLLALQPSPVRSSSTGKRQTRTFSRREAEQDTKLGAQVSHLPTLPVDQERTGEPGASWRSHTIYKTPCLI